MDIKINVTFYNGRCFFNGYNRRNDIDPNTQRAGINYYRFYLIGCILEKLGFAKGISCFEKDQPKIVYVNTKSFLKWRERHAADEYITLDRLDHIERELKTIEKYEKMEKFYKEYKKNPNILNKIKDYKPEYDFLDAWKKPDLVITPRPLTDQELATKDAWQRSVDKFNKRKQEVLDFDDDFEGSIKFILKSYRALSYDQVLEKAEKVFMNDNDWDKKMKIQEIKEILDREEYKEFYAKRKIPGIHLDGERSPEIVDFFADLPGIHFDGAK